MRRHTIQTTLICLMIASVTIIAPLADAGRPAVYVVGENGYFGLDSDGDIHYVLTSDGFRLYDVPTYGSLKGQHPNTAEPPRREALIVYMPLISSS